MPDPADFDSKDDFVSACIGEKVDEGVDHDEAVGACNAIWEDHVSTNSKDGGAGQHVCDGACGGTCCASPGGPSAHALPAVRINTEDLRTEELDGRTFRVVPVIPAVGDNVMNEALVPTVEWLRSLPSWNGRPLPVNHPEHNGMPISANDPAVLERTNVGFLFNARFDDMAEDSGGNVSGGKFKAEAWIDVDKAQRVAPDVLAALDEGRLEVSTAYFADDEPEQGEHDGKPYRVVHRNLRPDHVALLPNTVGACSWEDGCGAPRTHGGKMKINALETARTPSFDGTTSGEWNRPSFGAYAEAVGAAEANDVADLTDEQKQQIAAMSLLGNAQADTLDGLAFMPVVEPASGRLNENALDAVLDGRGAQADISDNARDSAREHARQLLEQHFDRDLEENRGLLKRAMDVLLRRRNYKNGGPDQNAEHGGWDTRQLESRLMEALEAELGEAVFVETVFTDDSQVVYTVIGEPGEPMRMFRRTFAVDEDGNITFEGDVQEVQTVIQYIPVDNAEGDSPGANPEGNMDERIKELISNEAAPFGENDAETLQTFGEDTLDKLVTQFRADSGAGAGGDGQPAGHADGAGGAAGAGDGGEGADGAAQPRANAQTVEQFIENAPDGIRDQLRTAQRQHDAYRADMIKTITSNERNAFSEDELNGMDTERLEKLAQFVRQPSFAGRGAPDRDGGPTGHDEQKAYTQDEVPSLTGRIHGQQAKQ